MGVRWVVLSLAGEDDCTDRDSTGQAGFHCWLDPREC